MNSLSAQLLDSLGFSADQLSTLRRLGECRGKQELFARQKPEVLRSLRQVAVIESSESSNRLEGITAAKKRLEDIVLDRSEPRDRSEQEIAGYRDALRLIHEARKDMPFSVNVVLQLHKTVFGYLPGEGGRWKMTGNEIIERGADGGVKVRFQPVAPVSVQHFMDGLVDGYRTATSKHAVDPLVIIPLVILDFLCIHPFADGNGRVARLLSLLMLYHFDYEVGRYISLERIVEESKETYYDSLLASSHRWHEAKHDVHPWLNYFWGTLLKAFGEFEERAGTIDAGRGSKTEQVRRAVSRQIVPFRMSDLERECPGVSRETIRNVLRELRDEGVVVVEGRGPGARWRMNDAESR